MFLFACEDILKIEILIPFGILTIDDKDDSETWEEFMKWNGLDYKDSRSSSFYYSTIRPKKDIPFNSITVEFCFNIYRGQVNPQLILSLTLVEI
jgi:hypothetical protein